MSVLYIISKRNLSTEIFNGLSKIMNIRTSEVVNNIYTGQPKLTEKDKHSTDALAFNESGHKKYLEVKFNEAVEDYTKAIEFDETLAVAYYNRGTIFYRMGYFKRACEDLEKAVTLDQSNEEFKIGLEACRKGYHSHSEKTS